jgi:beta-alanine degradation protein BauB
MKTDPDLKRGVVGRRCAPGRERVRGRVTFTSATVGVHLLGKLMNRLDAIASMKRLPASLVITLASLSATVQAQPVAPPSFVASPEVYRVVAENDQYRVVLVSWKPGQRDASHAHPAAATYFLTDCVLRFFAPDGSRRDVLPKAGYAVVQEAIASHQVENVGPAECRLVMFEPKQATP